MLRSGVTMFSFPGGIHVATHHPPSMPAEAIHAFYQTLEWTLQQTGRLEPTYQLLGYIAPAVSLTIPDQIKHARQDSWLRDISLQSCGGVCGVSRHFFATFQRMQVDTSTLPGDTTVFGKPDSQQCVVQTQPAFNALFRHFCYGLGEDLTLPPGAYYAGSSCVAAVTVPVATSENRLVQLEQRTQRKLQEPLMEKTISKMFPGKCALATAVMSFACDTWSLPAFNHGVERVLAETRGAKWRYDGDGASEADRDELVMSAHFDDDGFGPYARSDIDIIIVAQTHEEAEKTILATLQKVTERYKSCRVYETPCSIQVVGDWPQRHVQIITVLNKSLDEYFLFVDLDATALAFDGRQLYGCARSILALNTGYNIIPQQMLENRSDTPRRLHKYNERGFASLIPGELTPRARTLLWQAEQIQDGKRYLDIDWYDDDAELLIDAICSNTARVYSETNLPRGYGITAAMTHEILERLQAQARAAGRTTSVKSYDGAPTGLIFKANKTPENWVRWGLL